MKTTIDGAGRVVIPKALRDRLGLAGGAKVEMDERDGAIEIRPLDVGVILTRGDDGRPVFTAPEGVTPLTDADVRSVLEAVRR